jgi:hypothetical protein
MKGSCEGTSLVGCWAKPSRDFDACSGYSNAASAAAYATGTAPRSIVAIADDGPTAIYSDRATWATTAADQWSATKVSGVEATLKKNITGSNINRGTRHSPARFGSLGELLGAPMRPDIEARDQPVWPVAHKETAIEQNNAESYRQTAERLREMAAKIRFDFRRQQQLHALADGFDRLASRVEVSPEG